MNMDFRISWLGLVSLLRVLLPPVASEPDVDLYRGFSQSGT